MPHLVILYTPNIELETDMPALCRTLADTMIEQRDEDDKQVYPTGGTRVRFKPTPARQTASAIQQLCRAYDDLTDTDRPGNLLAIATFVFDFLCIHPFRDGNGRVDHRVGAAGRVGRSRQRHGVRALRVLARPLRDDARVRADDSDA